YTLSLHDALPIYAPARHRERRSIERAGADAAMAPVKEHRRRPFGRGKLQPPRCRLIGRLHLGNDAGERAAAQRILAYRKQLAVIAPLSIEDPLRSKPCLFQTRRIKVEARERPEHRKPRRRREARGDPGGKKRRSGVIAPACRGCGDFVKACAIKPAAVQSSIERRDAERQQGATRRSDARDRFAQGGKVPGARPGLCWDWNIHRTSTQMFPICST